MDVVLIPAFEPDRELIKVCEGLKEYGFRIVVVNDGSGEDYAEIFSAVKPMADIITLEKNSGKGAALKAGMRYIKDNLPDCEHFITCDADGQHRPEDVKRVSDQLQKGSKFVLTVRRRVGKIPFRSRFGNDLSKVVYALLANRYLSDNQSGLRGFSRDYLDWLIEVERNNYDYEMNVLYYAAKMGLKITTLTIDAIYIENNASSHFNPIIDTFKIYRSLFSLARGTFISFGVAELLIIIAGFLFDNSKLLFIIPPIGAISLAVCIILNKYIFFKKISWLSHASTMAYTLISYFVYTLMCMLLAFIFPNIPLVLNFNLVYLFCLPLRFFLHQLMFLSSLTKE